VQEHRNAIFVILAICGLVGGIADAVSAADARAPKNPVVLSEASSKAGQAIFGKYCGFCHGPEARGNGPLAPKGIHPPDLTDDQWTHGSTDAEIFTVIQRGAGESSEMRPFGTKLSDRDIWHVVNYLRSLAAKPGR
jgi:mono/diheme cytochrome c family protein